jgi:hypothetical protein
METVTLESVANIVTFVAPGYFAARAYGVLYAKADKELSRVLVESVLFSLPIIGAYDYLYDLVWPGNLPSTTTAKYALPLVIVSILVGFLFAYLRRTAPVRKLATQLNLPGPHEDFVQTQFRKLESNEPVTVTLRDESVFSGTPQGGSVYRNGQPRHYFFNNVAWYNKEKNEWEEREGSIMLDISDVSYIETANPLPPDQW